MDLHPRSQLSRLRDTLRPGVRAARSAARDLGSLVTELRARRLFCHATPLQSALLCVYRERNLERVQSLVDAASRLRISVALWSLDSIVPALASHTHGVGPGMRLELLNRLWRGVREQAPDQVIIADDDVSLARGSLAQLLEAARMCGFGIAQPARCWNNDCSHEITREQPLTLARETTFVEIGPLFVVTAPWISRVLPFPDGFGMGWGLEFVWMDLLSEGCRLGVVDCVAMSHAAAHGGREYDDGREGERLRSMLRKRNLESPADAQSTLRSWRAWQARPPWSSVAAGQRGSHA